MPTPSTLVELNTKQKQYLKGLAHQLNPYVQIGKEGLSESTIKTIDAALHHHELIKVKILESCPQDRKEVASELAQHTGASVAQILGRTILLYLPSPAELITLP